jgi:broad specificity phosphatase PhoE
MSNQIIHVFRHGEAAHNVEGVSLRDPLLTPTGKEQACSILNNYCLMNKPTLILISPLQRCIQTALYGFHPDFNRDCATLFSQNPLILAMPHLQETTENLCDTGSPLEKLKQEYGKYISFPDEFFSSDDWFVKSGTAFANDNELLNQRAEFVKKFIKEQLDQEVIVVTHGDFSHFLVNKWLYGAGCGSLFNGLGYAKGTPFTLVTREDFEHELHVEIPSWPRKLEQEEGSTK